LELESAKLVVSRIPVPAALYQKPSLSQHEPELHPNLHFAHFIDPEPASREILGCAKFVEGSQWQCAQAFVKGRSGMAR
jgi:hypothetical protein